MKKLSFVLVIGLLPVGAYAARTDPSTCERPGYYESWEEVVEVPAGYCCIGYNDNGTYTESIWNCDNLDLDTAAMEDCKTSKTDCINYCSTYDLDNNTCSNMPDPCDGWKVVQTGVAETDCTIQYAETCDYDVVCDLCGNNCHHEDETVNACIDGYYSTEDWLQCLKCPGNGLVDYDVGNIGSAQCYILRDSMTGSDTTGAYEYISEKCYYRG